MCHAFRAAHRLIACLVLAFCTAAAAQPSPPRAAFNFPVWQKGVIAVPPSTTGITYYVDGVRGSNASSGKSPEAAFATIARAVSLIAAGDTVLIRAGLYREGINLTGGPSGTAARPITFGSYGDGEVILDGSTRVTGWVNAGGTVWRAPVAFTPVGIVVNEVPLKQVRQGQGGSTAPRDGLAGVTSGSGKWHVGGGFITADFGTSLGAGDPNTADIVVPNSNGAQEHVFWYDASYVTFKGLTVRGSGSNGMWGYGSNITVDGCDIKFNGKAAVSFLSAAGLPNSDNALLMSHAYHNVLINWPRGNNGFAEAGGSWPGTVVWDTNLRPLARGNVVHMNGGEGIISYGTATGLASGSALFEQNVAYDNWSVNLYFDNQPGNVARNNFLFNHPPDSSNFLYEGSASPYDSLDKYSVCVMLADEQNSSDRTNGFANLRGSQVYNNILAGCRIGVRDYSEGATTIANHGLKDTIIMNNTIVMPFNTFRNADTFGIYLQDNGNRNANSVIANNVVLGFNDDAVFAIERNGPVAGITIDSNGYFSSSPAPFAAGFDTVVRLKFAQWKSTIAGADMHSLFADPQLADVTAFRGGGTAVYDWNGARPVVASPVRRAGGATGAPATDFTLASRPVPPSIGAVEPTGAPIIPPPAGRPITGATGMWWIPAESGWGMTLTQSASTIFAAWYTYDVNGRPKWFVASNCQVTGQACSGRLFEATLNAASFDIAGAFDPGKVQLTDVGSLTLDFGSADTATMSYSIRGQAATRMVSRMTFRAAQFQSGNFNWEGLWWNPSESGWGLSIAQQYDVMFLAWFTYGADGKPTWYVASSCALTAARDGCSGDLYATTGPAGPEAGPDFAARLVTVGKVGTIAVTFTDADNGSIAYTVNGRTATRQVSRQAF